MANETLTALPPISPIPPFDRHLILDSLTARDGPTRRSSRRSPAHSHARSHSTSTAFPSTPTASTSTAFPSATSPTTTIAPTTLTRPHHTRAASSFERSASDLNLVSRALSVASIRRHGAKSSPSADHAFNISPSSDYNPRSPTASVKSPSHSRNGSSNTKTDLARTTSLKRVLSETVLPLGSSSISASGLAATRSSPKPAMAKPGSPAIVLTNPSNSSDQVRNISPVADSSKASPLITPSCLPLAPLTIDHSSLTRTKSKEHSRPGTPHRRQSSRLTKQQPKAALARSKTAEGSIRSKTAHTTESTRVTSAEAVESGSGTERRLRSKGSQSSLHKRSSWILRSRSPSPPARPKLIASGTSSSGNAGSSSSQSGHFAAGRDMLRKATGSLKHRRTASEAIQLAPPPPARRASPDSEETLIEQSSRSHTLMSTDGASAEPGRPQRAITSNHAPIAPEQPPAEAMPRRRPTLGGSRSRRPLSAILSRSKTLMDKSPGLPLQKSMSTERLPIHSVPRHSEVPQVPSAAERERMRYKVPETMRKKDELAAHFRSLDSEYAKFVSKPSPIKVNIVRSALLPFLRAYADHPSNATLRPEDVDRRTNILNRWWTSLLEMVNGRNGQSVSGNDRPAVLEGLTGIMMRPEWVVSIHSGRQAKPIGVAASQSSSSIESSGTDFVRDSILHNARNTFVQNLLSQMAFVVDRMSLRNIPASIVAFCGRAAAYAFFYCPGVADILIRLWGITQTNLRRFLDEVGISRHGQLAETTNTIAQYFPSHLHHLAHRSIPLTMRSLRDRRPQSTGLDYIPWNGPWVGRWVGRDSDLFFAFIKSFHVLVCETLPPSCSTVERACAPAVALVNAQLLSLIDTTIHRGGNIADPEPSEGPLPITFDDVLGADAAATPLPPRPANALRLMAENRLILLLREFLAGSSAPSMRTRRAFADTFNILLRAAVRRISLFDHKACFTLCDFVEEFLSILSRYHRDDPDPLASWDWDFWFDVLRKMSASNNSMTDVRAYAFVYSCWGLLMHNERRKRDLCLDWLLDPAYFHAHFNHWCPMVRAYFMRLICWRVGRFDGDASDLDTLVFHTLQHRLDTTFGHFRYNEQRALRDHSPLPSVIPSQPAPGRRFLIMRDDSAPVVNSALFSMDPMLGGTGQPSTYQSYASLDALSRPPTSHTDNSIGRRKRGLWKSILPFSSTSSLDMHDSASSSYQSRFPAASAETKSVSDYSSTAQPSTSQSRAAASFQPGRSSSSSSSATTTASESSSELDTQSIQSSSTGDSTSSGSGSTSLSVPSNAKILTPGTSSNSSTITAGSNGGRAFSHGISSKSVLRPLSAIHLPDRNIRVPTPETPTHPDRTHRSFKFTLEWSHRPLPGSEHPRRPPPPRLPHTAQAFLLSLTAAAFAPPASRSSASVSNTMATSRPEPRASPSLASATPASTTSESLLSIPGASKTSTSLASTASASTTDSKSSGASGNASGSIASAASAGSSSAVQPSNNAGSSAVFNTAPGSTIAADHGSADPNTGNMASRPPNANNPSPASLTRATHGPRIVEPLEPRGAEISPSKYAGRALAEWALLLHECQSFFDRRCAEGVPGYRFVETPTLGVESVRRPLG